MPSRKPKTPPLTVILNPKSGSSGPDFQSAIQKALESRKIKFEILETDPQKGGFPAAQKAIESGSLHLLACGGDGTMMSVVNGIAASKNRDVVLSIIPGGTANLLAAALEIPQDVEQAMDIALSGQDQIVDLGKCGEHYFALGLGLGLTEKLVSQTSAREKEKLGKLAYVKAMLREMGARPMTFTFKLDNRATKRTKGVAIVIANSGTIGGKLHFAPRAKMNDGVLDLCILHRFSWLDGARLMMRSLLGQMPHDRAVSFYQAKRFEVRSNPPLDLQIDGEVVAMQTPLVVEIAESALTVRVKAEAEATQPVSQGEKILAELEEPTDAQLAEKTAAA